MAGNEQSETSARRAIIGGGVVGVVVVLAVFGAAMVPYDANLPDFDHLLAAPSLAHPLGTDDLGRDVLSRLIVGAQASVWVGFIAVLTATVVGTTAGIVAAWLGGAVDAVIIAAVNIVLAFPGLLLALSLTVVLGPGLGVVAASQAIVNLPLIVRTARGRALLIRQMPYVEARRALGFSEFNIMRRTILPNSLAPVIVQASLIFANSVIAESYLSFLGLGVQPPTPTWGTMLRGSIGFLDRAPWIATFAGLSIFLTVLGFNLIGDALHDSLQERDI
ncbi:MAG: ABC transporter permease [Ancalomicrobiaceae bacterium]|nr:ABC transporter permease [Ancalomicrobiaceae bacterium]